MCDDTTNTPSQCIGVNLSETMKGIIVAIEHIESDNIAENANSVKERVIQDIQSLCGMSISDAEQTVDLLQDPSREFRDNPGTRMSATLLFREIVESILDDGNNMRDKGGKRMRCESSV